MQNKQIFETSVEEFPSEFVLEMAKKCVKEKSMPLQMRKPINRPKCYYHDDEKEMDKCAWTILS